MNSDSLTTFAGAIVGVATLLEAFQVLGREQSEAIREAAPKIMAAVGLVVWGYFTNKR